MGDRNKRILGIILLCCGIAAVLAGIVIPLRAFFFPREWDTYVGIIGGADFPTYKLVADMLYSRLSRYVYLRLVGYGLSVSGIVLMCRSKKKA